MIPLTKSNLLALIIGMVLGIILSFLLANSGTLPVTYLERKLAAQADSLISVGETRETIARKKEGLLEDAVDSLKLIVAQKPKPSIIYNIINEKVNSRVRVLTDVQLDSVLTNYRYIPLTETGNR